ncbi:GNAT family N-acetyltransferase [Georgenia halophila]|uniref:GNAT family N-acetyltransferase n=1 Tax=Georgenia halophila TaxID=620889 RepID=UPI0031E509C4
MDTARSLSVAQVAPGVTFPLRLAVLRRVPTDAEVSGNAGSHAHFVVRDGGVVVATGVVVKKEPPDGGPAPGFSWWLMGMAVDPSYRRQGCGSLILAAVLEHVSKHRGRHVWCHARIGAIEFYRRHGFVERGSYRDDPVAGRQIMMHLRLS